MTRLISFAFVFFGLTAVVAEQSKSERVNVVSTDLNLNEAEKIAQDFLEKDGNPAQIVIVPGKTRQYDFGYVVQCISKKQLETGAGPNYGIPGIGPLIIDSIDRKVHQIGSQPQEVAIKNYLKDWKAKHSIREKNVKLAKHPGFIVSVEWPGGKETKKSIESVPLDHQFVFFKKGREVNFDELADTAVPIVRIEVYFTKDRKSITEIIEKGPDGQSLRRTYGGR